MADQEELTIELFKTTNAATARINIQRKNGCSW
jgi:hypothetical protein